MTPGPRLTALGRWLCVILLVAAGSMLAPPAAAASGDDCGFTGCTDVRGADRALEVTNRAGKSDAVPNRGSPATHGEAPERTTWLEVDEEITPACYANTREGNDALCPAATMSCPADDQMRWFVYHRVWRVNVLPTGERERVLEQDWFQEPGSYCLGPDDPGLPTIGRVIAQVQTGFRRLPLPESGPQVDPAPSTLVNIRTAFFAGGSTTAEFNPTILGTTVNIDAKATSWTWNWGDGSPSETFSTPGVPKRPVVSHTYRQPGDYTATVTVTWTGSFSIAGSTETFAIRQPVTVTSPPVAVQVRQARTELVDR